MNHGVTVGRGGVRGVDARLTRDWCATDYPWCDAPSWCPRLPMHSMQVEDAVRVVRATAEHEKHRRVYLRRMKALRAQLKNLEGSKG